MHAMDRLGVANILGKIQSEVHLVELIEQGLPPGVADALRELGDLTAAELGEIIPQRSLSRSRSRGRLTPEQSDRIIRAARTYALAHDVFANCEKANRWMQRPNRELAGRPPITLLCTSIGAELIDALLDRVADGVYS